MEDDESVDSLSDSSDDSYLEDEAGRIIGPSNGTSKGFCKGHWSKEEVKIKNQ